MARPKPGSTYDDLAAGLSDGQRAALLEPNPSNLADAKSLCLPVEGWRGPLLERKIFADGPHYQRTEIGNRVAEKFTPTPQSEKGEGDGG